MLTLVRPPEAGAAAPAQAEDPGPVAWWVRALSRLPLPVLYLASSLISFLAFRVFPYRPDIVRDSLARAFPDFTAAQLRATMHDYYKGFADMVPEIVKSVSMSPDDLRRRVRI